MITFSINYVLSKDIPHQVLFISQSLS